MMRLPVPPSFAIKQHGELFDLHRVKDGKSAELPYCSDFRSWDSAVSMAQWLAERDERRRRVSIEEVERVLEKRAISS